MRITQDGRYEFCRWARDNTQQPSGHISHSQPLEFFHQTMAPVRARLLAGLEQDHCGDCYLMEQHGKISGRQRQLLKIGVDTTRFSQTMLSSAWLEQWQQDLDRSGVTDLEVQDWQVDLGSYCNSACVFCLPESSSRVAIEQKKLGLIQQLPRRAWTDDPELVRRFTDHLRESRNLRYIHFIGGETLITPAFGQILECMIQAGLASKVTVGFTTNLTVMPDRAMDLLGAFSQVHLGMSLETMDRANDYIRYGSQIDQVRTNLDRWIAMGRERGWSMQIRTTPTILSVARLMPIYDFAWREGLSLESCNFLDRPEFMRPAVLPPLLRQQVLDGMRHWIHSRDARASDRVVNTRHPDMVHEQLVEDVQSYVNYLEKEPDQSDRLPDLARYLRLIDHSRGLRVIDYLPEYEELLRSAGY